jgi:hypothetical protein
VVPSERPRSLNVEQDLRFERREWAVQRSGWTVLLLILVAALLGLCGSSGRFGAASAGDEAGLLQVSYARFPRHAAPTTLEIRLGPDATQGERVGVWVDRAFLDRFELEAVVPEPESVELGSDRLTYVFPIAEPGLPVAIVFNLRADDYGRQIGRLGLPDGSSLRFRQFVLP